MSSKHIWSASQTLQAVFFLNSMFHIIKTQMVLLQSYYDYYVHHIWIKPTKAKTAEFPGIDIYAFNCCSHLIIHRAAGLWGIPGGPRPLNKLSALAFLFLIPFKVEHERKNSTGSCEKALTGSGYTQRCEISNRSDPFDHIGILFFRFMCFDRWTRMVQGMICLVFGSGGKTPESREKHRWVSCWSWENK